MDNQNFSYIYEGARRKEEVAKRNCQHEPICNQPSYIRLGLLHDKCGPFSPRADRISPVRKFPWPRKKIKTTFFLSLFSFGLHLQLQHQAVPNFAPSRDLTAYLSFDSPHSIADR